MVKSVVLGENYSQIRREFSMKYDLDEIQKLPNTFSLWDLCLVCHISKRNARYYLQSGLIPCTTTGKKTRCYIIRKEDLLAVLRDYEQHPMRYQTPRNGGKNSVSKGSAYHPVTYLSWQDMSSPVVPEYFQNKLSCYPDLLNKDQVSMVTGYNGNTISGWCAQKKISMSIKNPHLWIPKKELLRFLVSEVYNNIPNKSEIHVADILAIRRQIHDGGCESECQGDNS